MINERVCHMAKIKGVQVSATISPELNDSIEDHRWTVRKTKAEVIKIAVEEYAVNHQLDVKPADQDAESVPENAV